MPLSRCFKPKSQHSMAKRWPGHYWRGSCQVQSTSGWRERTGFVNFDFCEFFTKVCLQKSLFFAKLENSPDPETGGPPEGVRYMLVVDQAKISDEGLYTFDAQEGRATCTAKVHVKREPATVTKQLVARKIRDTEPFVEFVAEFSRPDVKVVWSRDNRSVFENLFSSNLNDPH